MPRRLPVTLALVLAACGTSDAASPDSVPPPTPVPTVGGVGRLPDTIPPETETEVDTTVPVVVDTRPIDPETGEVLGPIADRVDGNRVLVIGDSIMASTATRFGGEMCDELVPMGWAVEIDAEPGRFIQFGSEVLDRRLTDGEDREDVDASDDDEGDDPAGDGDWDAAVVHLGTNYGRDQESYRSELTDLLYRLAPRPTLLFTVTEYRDVWSEVNDVIREMADLFENVTLIDWEQAARTPGMLGGDGLHPGDAGEAVLVGLTSAALGTVDGAEGDCIRSPFTDDSAIREGGGQPNGPSSGESSSASPSGSSDGGSSSGATSGGSSSGGSTSGGSGSAGTDNGGDTDDSGTDGSATGGDEPDDSDGDGGDTDSSDSGGSVGGGTDSSDSGGLVGGGTDSSDSGGDSDTSSSGATTPGTGSTNGGSADGADSGGDETGGSTGATTDGSATTSESPGGSTTVTTTGGATRD